MAEKTWTRIAARAPTNIALVKYMGKVDAHLNLATNPSLSMTLDQLSSIAEISPIEGDSEPRIRWVKEPPSDLPALDGLEWKTPELKGAGLEKVEKFLARAEAELRPRMEAEELDFELEGSFELRTSNSFPAGTGIASSAASFAAMTLAISAMGVKDREAFQAKLLTGGRFVESLSQVARMGSGSACRSMMGPWIGWAGTQVEALPSQFEDWSLIVLLLSTEEKSVGSSEAHRRVMEADGWSNRVDRASRRFLEVRQALAMGDRSHLAQTAWQEFWDMHSLFHTSYPPFTYWRGETLEMLKVLSKWIEEDKPPVVTMDAGPNIHLMVPTAEVETWKSRVAEAFPKVSTLVDQAGRGASIDWI
jgi:diphosphomevalonate decarboxylase